MSIPRHISTGRFEPAQVFRPSSVAVVGAGTETGARILGNLMLAGFKGAVHAAVDAAALNQAVDLTVLALPRQDVAPAMAVIAAKGCRAAIIPGPADGIETATRATGVRILGPSAFGIAVPSLGLNATSSHMAIPQGRLALITQSGGLARSVIDWAAAHGVGFSHVIGIGENVDIGFTATLDWLSREAGAGAILLAIRRLKDRRGFLSAARAVARLRPVVALRDCAGEDAADTAVFEAALRRGGVLSVDGLEALLAAAETLSRARPLRREMLTIVTNAAGPANLAARITPRAVLNGWVEKMPAAGLAECAVARARETEGGAVLVVHAPTGQGDAPAIEALARAAPRAAGPILVCAMGETSGAPLRATLTAAGVPVFATPEQAVHGFLHLLRDRRNRAAARELPPSAVLTLAPDRAAARHVLDAVRRQGRLALMQDEALDVLAAYGIPSVPSRVVTGADGAVAAAELLRYPVVVKRRQAEPPAQRAPDGLALDLRTATAVARAAERLDGAAMLVQRQVARARELAVQVRDDATFGPVIAFGPGGTQTYVDDFGVDLPPLNLPLAHALIARTPVGPRLGTVLRDRPAANEDAVAETLVRVSQLVIDFPEIAALEIPALFADAAGVLAVDAWIGLRPPDADPPRLAIAPYPAELVERFAIKGETVTIRPVRPEDAAAHGGFFSRLSPQDIRFRFFSAMKELSAEQTVRLTQIDYDREMAFVAVREATGETLGVSRLVRDAHGTEGEFAVIVQPDMKGKGLATRLMTKLIDWARAIGMSEIVGQVLADNAPMLAFVRGLGFSVRRMPDDAEVMDVRLALTQSGAVTPPPRPA